jgi:hypothetical protein
MTAGEINRELDKLDVQRSELNRAFIEANRGYEKASETAELNDPLAVKFNAVSDRQCALRHEIERRYGPNAPSRLPLRQGFGPIKKGG